MSTKIHIYLTVRGFFNGLVHDQWLNLAHCGTIKFGEQMLAAAVAA